VDQHLSPETLQALLTGAGAGAVVEDAGAHLTSCGGCRDALGALAVTLPPACDPTVCEPGRALLAHARGLRYRRPEAMVVLAATARDLAESLPAGDDDDRQTADAQALAWGDLGNALRVRNDFAGAEQALATAEERRLRGTGDDRLQARLLTASASLHRDQGRYQEALAQIDRVYRLYRRAGDLHLAGRTQIQKGMIEGYRGRPKSAMACLARGLREVDRTTDPKLVLAGVHNLLWLMVDDGQPERARRELVGYRGLYDALGEPLIQLRRGWLEGRIAAGLDELEEAEMAFAAARAGFAERDQVYEAALVGLDLAALRLRQGRAGEMLPLVDEAVATFRSLRVDRRVLSPLLLLRYACYAGAATCQLLSQVAGALREHVRPCP
jgi:tetratricopeptide (TPR) repeat protein